MEETINIKEVKRLNIKRGDFVFIGEKAFIEGTKLSEIDEVCRDISQSFHAYVVRCKDVNQIRVAQIEETITGRNVIDESAEITEEAFDEITKTWKKIMNSEQNKKYTDSELNRALDDMRHGRIEWKIDVERAMETALKSKLAQDRAKEKEHAVWFMKNIMRDSRVKMISNIYVILFMSFTDKDREEILKNAEIARKKVIFVIREEFNRL